MDPDGIHRCVRHSKSEAAQALKEAQGIAGSLAKRAREELERREMAGLLQAAPDVTVDLSSPQAVTGTLERLLTRAVAVVPPAEAVKLGATVARALLGSDAVKPAEPTRPTGPRKIEMRVVRNAEDVAEVEREQARQDDIAVGIDPDEEPELTVGLH